jgi:hypothetical protein
MVFLVSMGYNGLILGIYFTINIGPNNGPGRMHKAHYRFGRNLA